MEIYLGFWSKQYFSRINKFIYNSNTDGIDDYKETIKNALILHTNLLKNSELKLNILTDSEGKKIINEIGGVHYENIETVFDEIDGINVLFNGFEKFFAMQELCKRKVPFIYVDYLYHIPKLEEISKEVDIVLEFFVDLEETEDRKKTLMDWFVAGTEFVSFFANFNNSLNLSKKTKTLKDFNIVNKIPEHIHGSDIFAFNEKFEIGEKIFQAINEKIIKLQDHFEDPMILESFALIAKNPRYFFNYWASQEITQILEKNNIKFSYYFDPQIVFDGQIHYKNFTNLLPFGYIKALNNTFHFEQERVQNWKNNALSVSSRAKEIKNVLSDQKSIALAKKELNKEIPSVSPSISKMAKNFASAMTDFAKSGFLQVTEEQHKARMAICNDCEFWQQGARFGLGKCLKCGCTGAKQWLATSVCPINKWGAISKEEVEASKEKENAEAKETQSPVSQQADGGSQEPSPEAQG